jgi:poly(hydroxyalkanoate) depolymerase family esterase
MKNPLRSLLKAAQKGPVSTLRALQRLAIAPRPVKPRPRPCKAVAAPRPARPAPGSFIDGQFTSPHGMLFYKLYTPKGSARRRLPLVVMLHGCTQSASDFAAGTRMNQLADELGFVVLYPQQSMKANMGRCWNWHRPGDQKRGRGEPATIAALTLHAIATCRANPQRVYIAGISAGGSAASIIGAAYPDLYVAVGVHSSIPRGTVTNVAGAMAAMRRGTVAASSRTTRPLPTIVFHGDGDKVVHPSNAGGFLSTLQRSSSRPLDSRSQQGRAAGGRAFTRTVHRHATGEVLLEEWTIHGSGHAWSGGSAAGSHTDPAGPDASREMLRFFLARKRGGIMPARPLRLAAAG